MYSKSKLQGQCRVSDGGISSGLGLTPPPGYDGSRFRRRSDGRDDAFPLYEQEQSAPPMPKRKQNHLPNTEEAAEVLDITPEECADKEPEKKAPIIPFLQNIGKEELLIISLIIILAGERERCGSDTILLLGLLLCIG